ncbi:hypothetical protein [Noviherbaspirillum pedocola]|uniref:Conjugal transfer protein TraN n=1 Tax=Noviherbaspirillum pedocola TaxID=2801341 RepID=A0A934W998_9BURK|nr:hypothetical protein [Noviherbaspirillum pedocola]MBK4737818.1 hypothetical protein [Noviherbaspirillum pedocola]
MRKLHIAVAVLSACMAAGSHAGKPVFDPAKLTSSHDQGINFGKSTVNSSAANASPAKAQDTPYYNPNPKQGAGFSSTDIFGIGVSRINGCKTEAKGTDQMANQECEAVNFLAKNPDNRKRFQLPSNDPAILAGRDAINKAKLDTLSDNGCVMKTTTTPDEHRIESCNEYNPVANNDCIMGRQVVVDDYSNYQCDQTLNAYEYPKCNKSPYFNTVMTPSCTVGSEISVSQHSATLNSDPCIGGDSLTVKYVCSPTDAPTLHVQIAEAERYDGGNYDGYQPANYYQDVSFSNCHATLRGNTTCNNGNCTGNYYADIFYGPPPTYYTCADGSGAYYDSDSNIYYCQSPDGSRYSPNISYGDQRGTYSGTLTVQASYQTYSKSVQYAGTTNTCQTLEARAQ